MLQYEKALKWGENVDRLTDIGVIKNLLFKHGFTFSKQFGQNFLINPSVCPMMAEQSGCENIGVIEIGPGIGVLTVELSKLAKKVVAIEIDERLRPILSETLAGSENTSVIFGDCMKLDLRGIIEREFSGEDIVVCANLPYYITTPILTMLLESRLPIKSITVMVQKEAAARLTAKCGSRECGAITACISYFAKPTKLFDVSRGSFMPAPNVDSSVIRLDLFDVPPIKVSDEDKFFKLIRAAFSQRRKTLCNSASSMLGIEKGKIAAALEAAGLSPAARAESLSLEDFAKLSEVLSNG
jgi:16S rRNA (adenine1518-N6/adenine1519-N6)-dimethyltransferase